MLRPTESRIVFFAATRAAACACIRIKSIWWSSIWSVTKARLHKPYLLKSLLAATEDKRSPQDHPIALPDGCHINLDPKLLPLLSKLQRGQRLHVREDYRSPKRSWAIVQRQRRHSGPGLIL